MGWGPLFYDESIRLSPEQLRRLREIVDRDSARAFHTHWNGGYTTTSKRFRPRMHEPHDRSEYDQAWGGTQAAPTYSDAGTTVHVITTLPGRTS